MEEDFGRVLEYLCYDHENIHICKVMQNSFSKV